MKKQEIGPDTDSRPVLFRHFVDDLDLRPAAPSPDTDAAILAASRAAVESLRYDEQIVAAREELTGPRTCPRCFWAGLLFLVALLVSLSGCAHQIDAYPQQRPMTAQGTLTRFVLQIEWVPDVDVVHARCEPPAGELWYACMLRRQRIADEVHCHIVVVRPRDFNDAPLLAMLGHEIEHCTGSKHQ